MTFLPVTALLEEMAFTSGMIFLEGMPRLDNNTTVGKNAIISKNTSLKLKNNYDAIVQLQDKTRHDRNRITKPTPPPPPPHPPPLHPTIYHHQDQSSGGIGSKFWLFTKWGRIAVNQSGSKLQELDSNKGKAISAFCKKYRFFVAHASALQQLPH